MSKLAFYYNCLACWVKISGHFEIVFLFFLENTDISQGDNLHEMSQPIFLEKKRERTNIKETLYT